MALGSLPPLSSNPWRASLWDVAGPPGGRDRCLRAHFLWCPLAGQIAQRTGGSYFIDGYFGGIAGCLYCFYCLQWGCTRSRLRAQEGIPGSLLEDMATVLLCPPCYLTQALNHLDIVEAERAQRGAGATAPPLQQVMARGPVSQGTSHVWGQGTSHVWGQGHRLGAV